MGSALQTGGGTWTTHTLGFDTGVMRILHDKVLVEGGVRGRGAHPSPSLVQKKPMVVGVPITPLGFAKNKIEIH